MTETITKRKMVEMIRQPIISVLGHVDSGKTKLLDAVRGTAITEKEAGGITQHIGATEVPIEVVRNISGDLINRFGFDISIPGLLFIDTPGHRAFTSLRKRGGSIADLAILVVDVMKGFQEQTIEAVEILHSFKTPFVVVANKIDNLPGWNTKTGAFSKNLANQGEKVVNELDAKLYEIVGKLHQHGGFMSERFDRVKDFTKEIPIIPVCAKTGEGLPELLMFLAGLSQKYLEKKLNIKVSGHGKGTVLEVKEEKGLGKTIDVIVYDGSMRVGEEIVLGGRNGVIKTKIRALLEPKPLEEIRLSREKFKNIKEIHAASGVKIAAPNLETALSGSPVMIATTGEEERLIEAEVKSLTFDSQANGPIVRADTLGSLEAMIMLLDEKGIKVKKADVGDVSKRDVAEILPVMEKDRFNGVIFAFNTKVAEEAKKDIEKHGVKVLGGTVIYRLLEEYEEWVKEEKEAEKTERLKKLTMPVRFTVLPGFVFRNSKPAIVGVRVDAGRLRNGVEVMKQGKVVGKVKAIQVEGKNVEEAKQGDEVAVSIQDAVVEKSIFEKDRLYSYIPKKQFAELEKVKDSLNEEELGLLEEIKKMEAKTEEQESEST